MSVPNPVEIATWMRYQQKVNNLRHQPRGREWAKKIESAKEHYWREMYLIHGVKHSLVGSEPVDPRKRHPITGKKRRHWKGTGGTSRQLRNSVSFKRQPRARRTAGE